MSGANNPKAKKESDYVGKRFHRLTVIKFLGFHATKGRIVLVKCDCGVEVERLLAYVIHTTKSCGCLSREHKKKFVLNGLKHNLIKSPLYSVYNSIKERCYRPKSEAYSWYGLRGIKMCKDWLGDFKKFHDWAISNGYKKGLQIDRVNNDGDYEPGNCRFVTRSENCKNRRKVFSSTKLYIFNGEKLSLSQIGEKVGLNYKKVYGMLKWHGEYKAFFLLQKRIQ